MERKIGYYAVLGFVIGAILGMGLGVANGSVIWGIWIGGLVGIFLG